MPGTASTFAPILAPSILAGNHARLADSLHEVARSGTPWVHLDIMDGHFVPNLTFGPQTVADLHQECPELFFDTHLMLDNPQDFIEAFSNTGSNLISIHVETEASGCDVESTLRRIRTLGCQNGLALNPDTPVESVKPFLAEVDLILVMTVQPGFGGQPFRDSCLKKISNLLEWRKEIEGDFRIEVDGGIDRDTGLQCRRAGADTLVAGTAFFNAPDREALIRDLTAREIPGSGSGEG